MSGVEAVAWRCGNVPGYWTFRKTKPKGWRFEEPLYSQATVDTLRAQLEAAEADAARAQSQREQTQQWYAERMAKIEEIAKREGLWDEVAAVFANGSATRRLPDGSYFYDPPTYAQQLNMAKHKAATAEARAEAAEAECARLKSLARLDEALEQAAGELPDGWIVSVCAEKGAGWVEMTDPEGERTHIDTDDSSLASNVLDAIEIARTKEQQA